LPVQAVRHLRGDVHGRQRRRREPAGECEAPGSGAAAQIQDPGRRGVSNVGEQAGQLREMGGKDLCVEFEEPRHRDVGVCCPPVGQEPTVEAAVRMRIRSLRKARGWSPDNLAQRAGISPSQLSRIETGRRRIALDQLTAISGALGKSLDELVESPDDSDVVIRPDRDESRDLSIWLLIGDNGPPGLTVGKMRITDQAGGVGPGDLGVDPGRDWFTVLSGTVVLYLGERVIRVEAGQAASFSTMTPHALRSDHGPAEILMILDHDGERSHFRT
jgi:transcriptional regulator with XRE-family HTH domain